MTWRKARGKTNVPEEKRKPTSAMDEYCDVILPGATPIWSMIQETSVKIGLGTATPAEIMRALESPEHPGIALYTQGGSHGRDGLALDCVNHGIDPKTGKPEARTVELLLAAICAGLPDREALQHAYLAAHDDFPRIMLADHRFAADLICAQRERALVNGL